MPFFPSNDQHPSPEPRSPTTNVFSVTNATHTYSSSTPLVYGSHPRLTSSLALLPSSPPIHKEREDAVKEEEPSFPTRENQVGRYGQSVFVPGREGPQDQRRPRMCFLWMSVTNATMSLSRYRHYLLNLRFWTMPSVPVMTVSGSTMTMPATPTKGGATLIRSVKKWV